MNLGVGDEVASGDVERVCSSCGAREGSGLSTVGAIPFLANR